MRAPTSTIPQKIVQKEFDDFIRVSTSPGQLRQPCDVILLNMWWGEWMCVLLVGLIRIASGTRVRDCGSTSKVLGAQLMECDAAPCLIPVTDNITMQIRFQTV
uniref:Uncharacterized protein n=1 Tax=Timema cristinae TaxID=61476 RepID=A0A7R9GXK8_TIMCR|nr:unnamed protein product [Timema cristinae]